ncbi:MAG: dTDP-4-dehydrorhamnose reductase, partial [Alistipes sp.]|nr:dTDP-4-dehydrorhamnose reductase [Alistipes sp.]
MLDILVTGAGGQLGCELQRLGAVSPNNYLFTDRAELDVTDADAVRRAVEATRAKVIVNCAAYTAVDRAEEEPDAAERLNATAAGHLAEAAREAGATLIHVSTDYVFDGRTHRPYTEEELPAPLNVYGRTKRAGEEAIARSGCKAIVIRTAWLYSEFGRNFLKTMLSITARQPRVNVVFDQVGTPTYAGDLALAIFSIVESGRYAGNEGIYHFSDEGVCSWYDFAVEIAAEAGHDACRIVPCR